jgi:hypothetical protein
MDSVPAAVRCQFVSSLSYGGLRIDGGGPGLTLFTDIYGLLAATHDR